jgi:hypothetical protein
MTHTRESTPGEWVTVASGETGADAAARAGDEGDAIGEGRHGGLLRSRPGYQAPPG